MDIIYRASDGTEFNNEDECKLYEKNLEVKVSQNIDSSISLTCSSCGQRDSRVIISRGYFRKYFGFLERQRECLKCDNRFTTYEIDSVEFSKYNIEELYDLVRDKKKKKKNTRYCSYCKRFSDYMIVNSREKKYLEDYFFERGRECLSCNRKFSTLELKLEKKIPQKKINISVSYFASDGKVFKNEDECNLYEKNFEKLQYKNYAEYSKVLECWGHMARKFENSNKLEDSKKYYEMQIIYIQKAIDLDDKNPFFYKDIGNNKFFLEEYQEAIDYYQKAIALIRDRDFYKTVETYTPSRIFSDYDKLSESCRDFIKICQDLLEEKYQ